MSVVERVSDGRGAFGQFLRDFRRRAALSQEELAERANMTAKAVSALERGERRRPYPSTVRALCDALDLDEADRSQLMGAVPPSPTRRAAWGNATRSSSMQPPTSLVGRDGELAQLLALLSAGATRLVTVTGPGGVGKTRLASAVVAAWPDDAMPPVVVELAPVRTADLVMPTVALSFGLQLGTADPVDSIVALVGDNAPLLVLDNVEHVLETAPAIADLIARCSGLVVLATSRAPLRIRAEQEFPLGPLSLPRGRPGVSGLDESSAARMFAERARAVSPTFAIDAANAGAIASICARLDGLPLALELAAAHIRYLSPQQLLERLDQVITTPGWRDGPERHQTLKSTLDWSYDLLTDAERRLLGAVSVFAGGFELDGLAHVSGGDPLRALNGLVEQSLVLSSFGDGHTGERRFRVLEPVRSYASSLTSDDESRTLTARHAEFYADLGIRSRAGLHGPHQARWLDQLGCEHANLRACLDTLLTNGEFGRAARLGGSTWLYWALRGHAGEGIVWCERVVDGARASGVDADDVAMAHLALAGLRLATGDITEISVPARAAADAGRRLRDPRLRAEALVLSATAATFAGDPAAALVDLGELSEGSMVTDDVWIGSHMLVVRAQLLMMSGDTAACRAVLDDAEDFARGAAGPFTVATVLNMQATLAQLDGNDDLALGRATLAARAAASAGVTWTLVYTLPLLAAEAASRGHHELAVALFAASEVTTETSLLTVAFRPDQEVAAGRLAALRLELSDGDFRRAWEWGRTLSVDDVVDLIPSISEVREPR